MAIRGARCDLTEKEVIPAKGGTFGKEFLVFRVFGQMNQRGKLRVCYARDVWWTNGLRIRIRLVVLSNFRVQSIFIRVTDYFLLIFKVLINFWNYYNY